MCSFWSNAILLFLCTAHLAEAIQWRAVPYGVPPPPNVSLDSSNLARSAASDSLLVQEITEKFVVEAPNAVSRVRSSIQSPPRVDHPFIFFHLRKAGGSSVRNDLEKAADELQLRKFIPCQDGVPCEVLDPPQQTTKTDVSRTSILSESTHGVTKYSAGFHVYGGHFYWPSMVKAMYLAEVFEPRLEPVDLQFDCLVIVRQPTSRVESCWNFRMIQANKGSVAPPPPISKMSASAIASELPTAMSTYGEGCNNEALRVFSNSGRAEESVNWLTSRQQWSPSSSVMLQETLEHMQHCVVGVLDRCEETQKVVHGFFPWFSSFNCKETKNQTSEVPHDPASPEVQKEIQRQNVLEMSVYKVANAMLDAQLAELDKQQQA